MTWTDRDLPALKAIVELSDEGVWPIRPHQIAERTGLDAGTTMKAINALAGNHPPYFSYKDVTTMGSAGRELDILSDVSGHARRTVGTWPTAEDVTDRIVAALQAAADEEPDEARKGKLRAVASGLANAGRDVAVGVISTVLTGGAA